MAKRKKPKANPSASSSKRPRPNDHTSSTDQPRGYVDPTTGQRGAFPGLFASETDFYGPALDGLAYLRMVRSEARLVPSLLLARPAKPELEGDTSGVLFSESTLISLAPTPARSPLPPFHEPLLRRFRGLRERLHASPPAPNGGVEMPVKERWLLETPPTPARLWSVDQQGCLKILGVIRHALGHCGARGVDRRVAEWAWGCLVRVDEVMTAEEVGLVREVGKGALRARRALAERQKVEGEGEDGEDGESEAEEGEEVEEKVQIDTVEAEGALDMIVSVVGDFFGQRDLLEERAALMPRSVDT